MRRTIYILTGLLILFLSGCAKYEIPAPDCPDNLPTNVSYATDIQSIFNQKCTVCHSGGQSPDLSPGWSYDELIDGAYVDTDFPCSSPLYELFSGIHGDRATEDEILYILGWIDEGAQDN